MASRHQVMCVNKQDRPNPHERILFIGGAENGERWRRSQQEAINDIETGRYTFYVHVGGYQADVIVAMSQWGHKYLRTTSDTTQKDNLLSLPECPR